MFICVYLWFILSGLARAQGPGWGETSRLDAFARGMGLGSPAWSSGFGANAFLPAGGFGGFVPYTPGPGQGVGVLSRSRMESPRAIGGGMGMPGAGAESGLGRPRGSLRPLLPIGILDSRGMGRSGIFGGSMGQGSPRGGMRPMSRPPVGSYPFRVPPSLLGPATSAPAMAM